jgi:hypothetical protein
VTQSLGNASAAAVPLDEIRDRIVAELTRHLPNISRELLAAEVAQELDRLLPVRVTQYLPVLVGRAVRDHHR